MRKARTLFAAVVAAVLALLLAALLNHALGAVPGFGWVHGLVVAGALVALLVPVAVAHPEVFAFLANRGDEPPASALTVTPKLLDSSAIIDGRALEVARLGFLEGPLVVPSFVLAELQLLADAKDAAKRTAGRRGLAVLEQLRAAGFGLEVREFPGAGPVDDRLVAAALTTGAVLVTNDAALGKVAEVRGVRVLNLNALAESLKARLAAGDELTITVVKEGSHPGQGVGYLDDGTMVVVEDGSALRGRAVRVAVVSNIQTALGRMVFAKSKEV